MRRGSLRMIVRCLILLLRGSDSLHIWLRRGVVHMHYILDITGCFGASACMVSSTLFIGFWIRDGLNGRFGRVGWDG